MKAFKNIAILLVFTLVGSTIYAQQAPMYTHYMYNTLSVNPAYAGSRDALTITALHRSQWVDFKGAPKTQTLTVHSPVRNEHIGLGLSVTNDKIGPTNNTSFFIDYAYRIKLTEKSKLAFGISAGLNVFQADLTQLKLDEPIDQVFAANINNKVTPNFGFGLYYSRERFYAGISVPSLIQNTLSEIKQANGVTLEGKEQRHYFFIAGTMLNISDNLGFKPTMLIKATPGAPIEADLTASFILMQKLLLGAMFRSGDAYGLLLGLDLNDQLHIGYSFDYSYGLQTFKYNQGSHEVLLRYDFIYSSKKQIHSPRYF